MALLHTLHHVKRDFKLWQLNKSLAVGIRNLDLELKDGDFTFTHATTSMLKELEALHHVLFRVPLISWIRWFYKIRCEQLVSVVLNKEGKVIGYDMFIFNEGEVKDFILHEPFVGVDPAYQGQGLSTKLRQYSISCYDFGVLSAISTVAGVDDIKAIRSAQKAGFVIVKASAKPPGHYMVRSLMKKR